MTDETQTGLFITFEGIEGVGKTTNLRFIHQWLQEAGIKALSTREPGGTPLAERLRDLLLLHWAEDINSQTELLMLFAGRAQHLNEVILPAIQRGEWVLCDRFTDATYAYQGYGRGLPLKEIAVLEESVQKEVRPYLTILFDAPAELGQQRVSERQQEKDRFEKERQAFFERVRQGYLKRYRQEPQRFHLIDATQPLEAVQAELVQLFTHLLAQIDMTGPF